MPGVAVGYRRLSGWHAESDRGVGSGSGDRPISGAGHRARGMDDSRTATGAICICIGLLD